MKKLLLVLLVVTLAAFLLVACTPVTPGEGEGEGEGEEEICPNLNITSQVFFGDRFYIQGGKQTITVTFALPHEPLWVYVDDNLRANPVGIPGSAAEVAMFPNADKTVYTGEFDFSTDIYNDSGNCKEGYIYVLTCNDYAPCKHPFTLAYSPGLCKNHYIAIE